MFTFGTPKDVNSMALNVRMGRATLFAPAAAVTGAARVCTTGERIRSPRDNGKPTCGRGKFLPLREVVELQGLPSSWLTHTPFKTEAIRQMLGNGVPLAMGRALARAVMEAISE